MSEGVKVVHHQHYDQVPPRKIRILRHKSGAFIQGTVTLDGVPTLETLSSICPLIARNGSVSIILKIGVFVSDPKYDFNRKKALKWAQEDETEVEFDLFYVTFDGQMVRAELKNSKNFLEISYEGDKRPVISYHTFFNPQKEED
jgi:hypothetical protein